MCMFVPISFSTTPIQGTFSSKKKLLYGSIDHFTIENDAKVSHSKIESLKGSKINTS